LGGSVEKKSLDEAERIARNLNRGIFCGKDVISIDPSFYELPFVKETMKDIQVKELNVYAVYEDFLDLNLP
jgi:hypothetical protein